MQKIIMIIVALSLAEIITFIVVGKYVGILFTLLMIIATSVAGAIILKNKGLRSLQSLQLSIAQGKSPGIAVLEAFVLFISGVLLLLPGFLTDIVGLILLLPITRNLVKPIVFKWVRKRMKNHTIILEQK